MNRRLPVQVGPWVPGPGSSTEERLSYKQEVRGSTPRSGTVVVVYRLCTRDCGSRGPGSTPRQPPKGARRRWRVGPACKAGASAERVRIPRLPPYPRSSGDRARRSERRGRPFESARGYARPHVRVVKVLVRNTSYAGSIPAAVSYAIHCGQPQAGAGCPTAPHKGGASGSTPGPATDVATGKRHRRVGEAAAGRNPGSTNRAAREKCGRSGATRLG